MGDADGRRTKRSDSPTVLHLFGGPYISAGEQRSDVPEGSKRLLAFVALQHRKVDRRYAAGALWPDVDDGRAGGNLRSALWRLRGVGIDVLLADKTSLALRKDVVVDLQLVHEWATRLISETPCTSDLVIEPSYAEALDLLPGWYDDWALVERERSRQQVLHGLDALSRRLLELGRHAEAIEAAMLALRAEPMRESTQRVLIEAHLAEGNRMEAVRAYSGYCRMLLEELGVRPSADIEMLVRPMAVDGRGPRTHVVPGVHLLRPSQVADHSFRTAADRRTISR